MWAAVLFPQCSTPTVTLLRYVPAPRCPCLPAWRTALSFLNRMAASVPSASPPKLLAHWIMSATWLCGLHCWHRSVQWV